MDKTNSKKYVQAWLLTSNNELHEILYSANEMIGYNGTLFFSESEAKAEQAKRESNHTVSFFWCDDSAERRISDRLEQFHTVLNRFKKNTVDAVSERDDKLRCIEARLKKLEDQRNDLTWVVHNGKIIFLTNAILHKEFDGRDWITGLEDGIHPINIIRDFRIFTSRWRAEEYLSLKAAEENYQK